MGQLPYSLQTVFFQTTLLVQLVLPSKIKQTLTKLSLKEIIIESYLWITLESIECVIMKIFRINSAETTIHGNGVLL